MPAVSYWSLFLHFFFFLLAENPSATFAVIQGRDVIFRKKSVGCWCLFLNTFPQRKLRLLQETTSLRCLSTFAFLPRKRHCQRQSSCSFTFKHRPCSLTVLELHPCFWGQTSWESCRVILAIVKTLSTTSASLRYHLQRVYQYDIPIL